MDLRTRLFYSASLPCVHTHVHRGDRDVCPARSLHLLPPLSFVSKSACAEKLHIRIFKGLDDLLIGLPPTHTALTSPCIAICSFSCFYTSVYPFPMYGYIVMPILMLLLQLSVLAACCCNTAVMKGKTSL